MKTLFKILFIGLALLMLLSMFGAMFGGWALLDHHGPNMHIALDDGEFIFGNNDFADWLGGSIGLFVAAVVCLLVVPLVVVLGVALPLLVVGGVLAMVLAILLGVGALLGSPLILLGLLAFVVLRNRRRARLARHAPSASV